MDETNQKPRILLIEDDPDGRRAVADALRDGDCEVLSADCGRKGVELFDKQVFDAVLSDIKLPDIDGLEVLREIKRGGRDTPVLLMTAYGTVKTAVEALKAGAYDYILKPLDLTELQSKISHAIETRRLRSQVASLKQELLARPIIGKSKQIKEILAQIKTIAPTKANVLVLGESGTGKELVARALHAFGTNPEGPFIAVNCGAFAESLLESELFGHEKGAFTGATQMRAGAFERAHNGTLFLDEIGLASAHVQSRLLRVLEEREIMRVGGSNTIKLNVRIISASNRNPEDLVAEKIFRPDLLYRLQVITIRLPPLRERPDDIRPLADYFIARACENHGKHIEAIEPDFYSVLEKQPWPGNVRELANAIESAVVLATTPRLTVGNLKLPASIQTEGKLIRPRRTGQLFPDLNVGPLFTEAVRSGKTASREREPYIGKRTNFEFPYHQGRDASPRHPALDGSESRPYLSETPPHQTGHTFAEIERAAILGALQRHKGNRTLAAKELDISPRTIQRKIKEYDLPF